MKYNLMQQKGWLLLELGWPIRNVYKMESKLFNPCLQLYSVHFSVILIKLKRY